MKFDILDDKYIAYLNKDYIKNVDFKIRKQVEDCFRNVFTKIKKIIDKDINGFFDIKVYLNDNYGAILIIKKEEIEYYDYFSNQIDMQIEIEFDSVVLLEFNDFYIIKNNNVYLYNNKYYIKYVDDINYVEFSKVVFGKKADEIIKKSNIIISV